MLDEQNCEMKKQEEKKKSPIAALMQRSDEGTAFVTRKVLEMKKQNTTLIAGSQLVSALTAQGASG
jgi:hypothetical protein